MYKISARVGNMILNGSIDETGLTEKQIQEKAAAIFREAIVMNVEKAKLSGKEIKLPDLDKLPIEYEEILPPEQPEEPIKEKIYEAAKLDGLSRKELIEQNAAESEVVSTMNRGRKAFVDRARDLGFTESAIADLVAEYGMIPESVTTIVGQAGAAPAATQVSTLKDALKGLPKDTQTDVLSIFNTKGIDAAYTALSEIDGEKADAWIKSILERSGINDWDSYKPKSKNAYINTYVNTYKTVYTGMAGRWQKSADGGMYGAGMVQEFADGGFPSIGSQQPQIQPNHGPGGIRWAEEGAGPWEAFVSGHPAKRARSRMIAAEAVGRLGGDVAWANADGNLMKSALYQHQPAVQSPAGTGGRSADPVSAISAAAIREALDGARLELSGADAFSDTLEARIVTSIRRA